MKKILWIVLAGLILAFPACKEQDSLYKQYIVPNGISYPGKASDVVAHPGKERIEISWKNGSDPKVISARIFWNNYTDSVETPVNADMDTIRRIISPLAENTYSFMIRTYDADGNISIPVEIIGTVYGENYQSMLLSRPVAKKTLDATGALNVQWGPADIATGAVATEVKYAATEGDTLMIRTPATSESSSCPQYKAGSDFYTRTLFVPDSLAIDTFYTVYEKQRAVDL